MTKIVEPQNGIIQGEVLDQFNLMLSAINRKDAGAWSEHFSPDGFLSALAGAEYFDERKAWVDAITSYFAARDSQYLELVSVRISPLASDLALLTSQEKTEMVLEGGQTRCFMHVYTMIWKKEQSGWKIVHSHESWE